MADQDPVAEFLRTVPGTDRMRAAAWDAAYAQDDAEAERRLREIPVSDDVKAKLWDLRKPVATTQPKGLGAQVWEGVKQLGSDLNPLSMIDSLGRAMIPQVVGDAIGLNTPEGGQRPGAPPSGPVNALNAILGASWDELQKAKAAYDAGDVATATRHVMGSTPVIGPPTSQASDMAERGDYGRAAGRVASIGVQMAAPQLLDKARQIEIRSPLRNRNAAEAEAVDYLQNEGVPVDAATATGNRFVKGVQRGIADQSLGGSVVAERGRAAEAQALTATGERLAGRVHPTAVTPEQAGEAVRAAVTEKVTGAHETANAAYSRLAALEKKAAKPVQVSADRVTTSPILDASGRQMQTVTPGATETMLAVDVSSAKTALQPLYERLMREKDITPLMGDKGRAAAALDRLMRGPDVAPLSVVDDALGDLKAMARGADMPELRTQGQGLAAEAVQQLERRVQQAAKAGGKDVVEALMSGRLATRAKYGAADVLEQLKNEPVQVFNQATWAKDAGIDKLRGISHLAPKEMAQVGRAYLEDLLGKATSQGAFDQTQGLWAQWQKLGPETKRVLFRDQALISDLDKFFLGAKKLGESPNPSGTALTLMKGAEAGTWYWNPGAGAAYSISATGLAKLLRNPRAVRILSQGMSMRVGGRAASATALTTELAGLAKANGVSLVPVTAQDTATPARSGETPTR